MSYVAEWLGEGSQNLLQWFDSTRNCDSFSFGKQSLVQRQCVYTAFSHFSPKFKFSLAG